MRESTRRVLAAVYHVLPSIQQQIKASLVREYYQPLSVKLRSHELHIAHKKYSVKSTAEKSTLDTHLNGISPQKRRGEEKQSEKAYAIHIFRVENAP